MYANNKVFWSLNFLRIVWVEFQKQFVTRLRGVEFVILANLVSTF